MIDSTILGIFVLVSVLVMATGHVVARTEVYKLSKRITLLEDQIIYNEVERMQEQLSVLYHHHEDQIIRESQLRKQYPTLEKAWSNYQMLKSICETKND